jgi:hypothetical protein
MTITTTLAAMQTLNRSVTGITTAPTSWPVSLNTAGLPLAITFADEGQTFGTFGSNISQRVYTITVYVMPSQQGLGIDEGIKASHVLLQAMIDAYRDSDNALLVSGTYQASIRSGEDAPITDSGFQPYPYPPQAPVYESTPLYFGFQLRVTVKETWAQT